MLIPVGHAIIIRVDDPHHGRVLHGGDIVVLAVRTTGRDERNIITRAAVPIRTGLGVQVHVGDGAPGQVVCPIKRVACILDVRTTVIEAVGRHQRIRRLLDLVHGVGDHAAVAGQLPNPELVQHGIRERCRDAADSGSRIEIEGPNRVVTAFQHDAGRRQQPIDMDSHRVIAGTVDKGHMRPCIRIDGAAHHFIDGARLAAHPDEGTVVIQTNLEHVGAGRIAVGRDGAALVARAGLHP